MQLCLLSVFCWLCLVWPSVKPLCLFNCPNISIDPEQFLPKPWWKGPNVCKYEDINENEPEQSENDKPGRVDTSFSDAYSQSCFEFGNSYICTTNVVRNGKAKNTIVTYACCPGFERVSFGFGCEKEVGVSSLTDTLKKLNLTQLKSAFDESLLNEILKDKNVTIFAPSDIALAKPSTNNEPIAQVVVFETGDLMLPVRDILLGTMTNGSLSTWNMIGKTFVDTLKPGGRLVVNGEKLSMGQPLRVNCVRVKKSDVHFDGGVIHVFDSVVQPAASSVWALLESSPQFSTFRSLIGAELKSKLEDPKSGLTVLAFTNDAFDRLSQDVRDKITTGKDCYKNIVKHHILRDPLCSDTLEHLASLESIFGQTRLACHTSCVPNAAGSTVTIHKTAEHGLSVSKAPVVGKDLIALNGVVHVLGEVMIPTEMLPPVDNSARWSPQMESMLKRSGLLKEVAGEAYSLLIPPADVVEELASTNDSEKIKAGLSRYVMRGDMQGTESVLTSLAGEQLKISRAPQSLWPFEKQRSFGQVNCVQIAASRAVSCFGTVYRIAKPLPPNAISMMAFLRGDVRLQQFTTFVEAAGYDTVLSDTNSSVTVMAFTDEKFDQSFDDKAKADLLADKEKLKQFIGGYILKGSHCCSDMTTGLFSFFDRREFDTLSGQLKTVSGNEECCMKFGQTSIVKCNAGTAPNGIMHLIKAPEVVKKVPAPNWNLFDLGFNNGHFNSFFNMF